jgi:hypothetical protein
MTKNLTVRQRLLARISNISEKLGELDHLPQDRLLAIDISMTEKEHTEWLRRLLLTARNSTVHIDGNKFFEDMEKKFRKTRDSEQAQNVTQGSGTPNDIAERIGQLQEGNYRFTIQRMPTKEEVAADFEAIFKKCDEVANPEFIGKTDDEIQNIINQWVKEARSEIIKEEIMACRSIAIAQLGGLFSKDELLFLAYEMILSRFGADIS